MHELVIQLQFNFKNNEFFLQYIIPNQVTRITCKNRATETSRRATADNPDIVTMYDTYVLHAAV